MKPRYVSGPPGPIHGLRGPAYAAGPRGLEGDPDSRGAPGMEGDPDAPLFQALVDEFLLAAKAMLDEEDRQK